MNYTTPSFPFSTTEKPSMLEPFGFFLLQSSTKLLLICGLLLTILGNLAVVLTITCNHRSQKSTFFIVVNLAIIDLLVGILVVLPLNLYVFFPSKKNRFMYGSAGCIIFAFCFQINLIGSTLFMTLAAFERFIAICFPLDTKHTLTKRRLSMAVLSVWSLVGIFGIWTILGSHKGQDGWCNIKMAGLSVKTTGVVSALGFVVLPLIIVFLLYTVVCIKLLFHDNILTLQLDRPKPVVKMRAGNVSTTEAEESTNASPDNGHVYIDSKNTEPSKRKELGWFQRLSANKDSKILKLQKKNNDYQTRALRNAFLARVKLVKLLVIMVVLFFIFSIPFIIISIIQPEETGNVSKPVFVLSQIAVPMLLFNSGVNPLIYLILSKNLRRSFYQLCRRPLRCMFGERIIRHHRGSCSSKDPSTVARATIMTK